MRVKARRSPIRSPSCKQGLDIGVNAVFRIQFKIIEFACVNSLKIALCAADRSVATVLLPLYQRFKRTMHGDEENIVMFEEIAERIQPLVCIENMLKN